MKNFGLVMCSCLCWTAIVHAQSVYPPAAVFNSPTAGRAPISGGGRPVYSGALNPEEAVSGNSPSTSMAAGYEEYESAPPVGTDLQAGGQQSDLLTPNSDPFASQSDWVDVSGLDLFGVMPYYSNLQYGNGSVKNRGDAGGVYGYASTTFDMVEFAVEHTAIDFRSGFHFHQEDYTFVWNNYDYKNFRWRAGLHFISSNSAPTNGGVIGILGAHFYKDRWEAGTDFYVTNYSNFDPALTVLELSPHVVFPWLTGKGEVRGYYIHSNIDLGLGKRDFLSVEGRLTQDYGKINYGAYGWGGEQTFAVRNDGFLVYNLTEKHRAGYGGEVSYKFTDHTKITGRAGRELFSDFVNNLKTQQTVLSVLFLHTF